MAEAPLTSPQAQPGYRGVWYGNQPCGPPYHWKYSGGLATYPQQHTPIAIYSAEADKTYFVYGGQGEQYPPADYAPIGQETPGETRLCVGSFDHRSRTLSRPISLLTRDTFDAHENPVLCLDDDGRLLVFCPAHGSQRPSYVFRTAKPHDLSTFELVRMFEPDDNFSYPQPWWLRGQGLIFLHTRYDEKWCRRTGYTRSPDGIDWPGWHDCTFLSKLAQGSYQISWPNSDGALGVVFDVHPEVDDEYPLNFRTNLYYAQSHDAGQTWQTADGQALELPLTQIDNPARVFDGQDAGVLVYLKDLDFDQDGQPVILYLTSQNAFPGPEHGPHRWRLATFDGSAWSHHDITASDHNYDHGSLLLRRPDDWRLIGPTSPGPQAYATGGTMCLWRSTDRGKTWAQDRVLVEDKHCNHTYARRPLHAHDDFAVLWAAANAHEPGPTRLLFSDIDGHVYTMPEMMAKDHESPLALHTS